MPPTTRHPPRPSTAAARRPPPCPTTARFVPPRQLARAVRTSNDARRRPTSWPPLTNIHSRGPAAALAPAPHAAPFALRRRSADLGLVICPDGGVCGFCRGLRVQDLRVRGGEKGGRGGQGGVHGRVGGGLMVLSLVVGRRLGSSAHQRTRTPQPSRGRHDAVHREPALRTYRLRCAGPGRIMDSWLGSTSAMSRIPLPGGTLGTG
jgi:hypothetical protein